MASYRITVKDWLLRTGLELKSNLRYIGNCQKEGIFEITSNYNLVFYDTFMLKLPNKWEDGSTGWEQPYHPSNLTQGFDPAQIKYTSRGIELWAIQKEKYFQEENITIPNAIGVMRTKQAGKYGLFIISCKLPAGTKLGPALGLSGAYNWPPEIDLLEGYSDDTIDFHKGTNLQSNVHISDGEGSSNIAGARKHRLPNAVTNEFIEYVIWWEPDFIKLYYNGFLVRHITDREILDGMFEEQKLIIGTGVQSGFNKNNLTPMIVNKVSIYQK